VQVKIKFGIPNIYWLIPSRHNDKYKHELIEHQSEFEFVPEIMFMCLRLMLKIGNSFPTQH
jgi:hypothetical protein